MYLLTESKQSIINLGYPEIVAKLYFAKFGNKAYLLARWYKEYYSAGLSDKYKKDWFIYHSIDLGNKHYSVRHLIMLYDKLSDPIEYVKLKNKLEISDSEEPMDSSQIQEEKEFIISELKEKLFDRSIFYIYYDLVKEVISGKIKNLSEYDHLNFYSAVEKYETKKLFRTQTPFIQYKNGYRWIDAGKKCNIVGNKLKNCGSVGVMGTDPDRHMYVLFDVSDNPHVVVTHSPNEKLLNGIQGIASSEIKDQYVKYVLHLAKKLKVNFKDTVTKYILLKCVFKNVSRLRGGKKESIYNKYYKFDYNNETYVSNGEVMILKSDLKKIYDAIKSKTLKLKYNTRNVIRDAFDFRNRPEIKDQLQVNYINANEIIYTRLHNLSVTPITQNNT
jgi:hypothetical protein